MLIRSILFGHFSLGSAGQCAASMYGIAQVYVGLFTCPPVVYVGWSPNETRHVNQHEPTQGGV